jgi:hypothetical protein
MIFPLLFAAGLAGKRIVMEVSMDFRESDFNLIESTENRTLNLVGAGFCAWADCNTAMRMHNSAPLVEFVIRVRLVVTEVIENINNYHCLRNFP